MVFCLRLPETKARRPGRSACGRRTWVSAPSSRSSTPSASAWAKTSPAFSAAGRAGPALRNHGPPAAGGPGGWPRRRWSDPPRRARRAPCAAMMAQMDQGDQQPIEEDQLGLSASTSALRRSSPRASRTRTAARPPTHWRARRTTRRNVRVRRRTGQDGNRPRGPRSASQLTQPVRPFSCHAADKDAHDSAAALQLPGLDRVSRDLEDELEPVALVPCSPTHVKPKPAMVAKEASLPDPILARTVLTPGFGGGPDEQRCQHGAGIALAAVPGHDGVADLDHAGLVRRPMEPGVADNGPVRLGHGGPHDPGRDRGVLGELASAIAEDPAGRSETKYSSRATPASALPPARSPSASARSALALSSTKRTRLGRSSLVIAEMLAQHRKAVHRFTDSADTVIVPDGPSATPPDCARAARLARPKLNFPRSRKPWPLLSHRHAPGPYAATPPHGEPGEARAHRALRRSHLGSRGGRNHHQSGTIRLHSYVVSVHRDIARQLRCRHLNTRPEARACSARRPTVLRPGR